MNLLVWDFDGTLARSQRRWSASLALALERVGAPAIPPDALRPWLQRGFPWHDPERVRPRVLTADEWWERLLPLFVRAYLACGVAPATAVAAAAAVRGIVADPGAFTPYPDALPALAWAGGAGWTQAILSNHIPELPAAAEALGFTRYVDRVFTSAALRAEKPHPLAFRSVLDAYPDASTAVMVGDSPSADVAGARAVGMRGILARTDVAGPDAVATLADLPARLGPVNLG